MSGQRYKRTNFEDDEASSPAGTPPGITYDPSVAFKVGASFWQKRTNLEKLLAVALVIWSITMLILFIMVVSRTAVAAPAPNEKVCMSKSCVTTSSSILNALDVNVNPCADFFQYSCGGWLNSHSIPSGLRQWGTFNEIFYRNQLVLKKVLEKHVNKTFENKAEEKARKFYESCLDNSKKIEKLGAKPLLALIKKLGGWSVSDKDFDISTFDFQDMMEKLSAHSEMPLFSFWIGEDEKDSSRHIFQLNQGGLQFNRARLLNGTEPYEIEDSNALTAFVNYLTKLSVLLGGERNASREMVINVVKFQQKIAQFTQPEEERRNDLELYHLYTFEKLQKEFPFMNWLNFVNKQFKFHNINKVVTKDEPAVVHAIEFLSNMTALLKETQKTKEGNITLHNYLMWSIIEGMSSTLSKPFRDARKQYTEAMYGSEGHSEKWRRCLTDTDGNVGFALGRIFVDTTFFGESRKEARVMISNIKDAFISNLQNLKWMTSETKKKAKRKALAVYDMVGYPDYINNKTELEAKYKDLEIKEDEYFNNTLNSMLFSKRKELLKLRKKPDRKEWNMTPQTVNAYYQPTKNQIVFPAGILQTPFYDSHHPKSLNYGGIGVVLGHELTHGFDDQGRKYNETGMLNDWWNKEDDEKFKEKAECMVKQYGKYKLNGKSVKGRQTLGENIADNGGLKAAFTSYQKWVKENGEEVKLPGLSNYTHEQLFFISFAQVWCSMETPKAAKETIMDDTHTPDKYRVIGTLSNSKEFSEHFSCPVGSPMNPKHKCIVW